MVFSSQRESTANGIKVYRSRMDDIAVGGGSPRLILCGIDEEMLCKCSDKCSDSLNR